MIKGWIKTYEEMNTKDFTLGLLVMLGGVTIGLLMSLLLQVV